MEIEFIKRYDKNLLDENKNNIENKKMKRMTQKYKSNTKSLSLKKINVRI